MESGAGSLPPGANGEYAWYARAFIIAIVLLFLWMLWRRKKRYSYKPIKKYQSERSQFRQYLDRYAASVANSGVDNFKNKLNEYADGVGLPAFLPSSGGGATTSPTDGLFIGTAGAAATAASPGRKVSKNKTEEECRAILERLLRVQFDSVRPDWLKNPRTGKNLEIDCYNESLQLAVEYNGQQHYRYCSYFHKSKADFYAQVHRDDWKRKQLRDRGIKVLEIPYWLKSNNLEDYIKRNLRKHGFVV